ncbi:hypothetical protein D3C80_1636250 [compost metagenome]
MKLAWLVMRELSVYLSALSWIIAAPSKPTPRISTATSTSINVMPACALLLQPFIRNFHPIRFVH